MNLFRGAVDTSQVFPYPEVLNEEQKDTLKMFIDPTAKFFEVMYVSLIQSGRLNLED